MSDSHRWARWGLNTSQDIGPRGDVMLTRHRLVQTPWFGVYVHRIFRPDHDRDLHDHPWSFWTMILRGGYHEEYARVGDACDPRVRRRRWARWSVHRMHAERVCHRITYVFPETMTLVIVGRKWRRWGFHRVVRETPTLWYVDGWMHWREYLGVGEEPMVP